MNNVQLDFSLSTDKERLTYINNYIDTKNFSEDDLELMANYLLWGKDENGLNSVQRKEVEINTKSKTWDKKEIESLDNLMDNPSFCENLAIKTVPTKRTRETFNREEALQYAPEAAKETYLCLFQQIDQLDLLLNFYDIKTGKRKTPPRAELLNKFTVEEQQYYQQKAQKINPFGYLKLRHYLVDLRRQQFFIKDSYSSNVQNDRVINNMSVPAPVISIDIPVLPLGLITDQTLGGLLFRKPHDINPYIYTPNEKELIFDYIDELEEHFNDKPMYFDFRDEDHLYNFLLNYHDLMDSAREQGDLSVLKNLFFTLEYYVNFTKLPDMFRDMLTLKIDKTPNQEIANIINKRYGKSYSANYISTIFKQKIIKQLCDNATYHWEMISNLRNKEHFKKCIDCGQWYLRDSRNFMKKSRSKDGFSNRCKKCERILRKKRSN